MASELSSVADSAGEYFRVYTELSQRKTKFILAQSEEEFFDLLTAEAVIHLSAAIERELSPALQRLSDKKSAADRTVRAFLKKAAVLQDDLQSVVYELRDVKDSEKILGEYKSVYRRKLSAVSGFIADLQELKAEIE